MNHLEIRPYDHNRRLYLLIGLWPYEDSSIRYWRVCVVTSVLLAGIITQTYLLFISELKLQAIMDIMTTYLPTICFTACYYNILFHLDGVRAIQNTINNDVNNLLNEQEWNAMKKYIDQNKLYSIMIACVFYFYAWLLCFPAFYSLYLHGSAVNNDTKLVLPVRIEYCLHYKIPYFIMLLIQLLSIFITCTVGIAYYTMVIACLQHACSLFTIVTVKIEQSLKAKVDDFYSMSSNTRCKKEHREILSVIKYYNHAINFVGLLTSICTKTYFIEILLALLLLIIDFLQFFQLLDMMVSRSQAFKSIIYILGTIMMIYSAFYMGQRLIDHSITVYAQCCQIPFYALSIKTRKLLVLLIMRSLKPCSINVSGMMVTSHEVFAKIANVSYSFAIVCYKMR